ncbi:MAG: PAS domain S-box protein [Gemmatimonadota bacterium]|nr:PAS domain S-box protein [Gemmatimonadota bacterium]
MGARAAAYCALSAGLLLLFLAVRESSWTVAPALHGAFELAAAVVALIAGILALVRFYSRKNDTLLLIGAAMIGASVLDTYHLFVTTGIPFPLMPLDHEATEPWSWFGSRFYLSLMLLWSWTAWHRENRDAKRGLSELRVYMEVGAITVLSIALFGLVALPEAIRTDSFVPRPFELLPGALFAFAAIGYLSKGNWRNRPFEVWLIPALLVSAAIQLLFIPFSSTPVDAFATVSHALKLLSYGYILVGLIASMFGLYRRLERSALLIEHSNAALRGEVAEREAAQAETRRSEEKYRNILATIQEGYFEVDLAGNFVFWNESLTDLLGYRHERMAGLNYRAYTRDAHSAAVFEVFSQVYRTGQPVRSFGWEILRPDGTRRYAEASAGPVRGEDGEIVGFRGIVRDVTARRSAEERLESKSRELARSNEELRQFAYVASHDLQEPLRMVAGYTQLLARRYEGRLDAEADLFIRYTVEGVNRMQALIRDLLDYSRVQTHGRSFELVSLDSSLDWALANLEAAIEMSGASIVVDALPDVRADPTQMGQLLQNLIGNAIKFRADRPLAIHVGAQKRAGEWQIFVRDNGIGVEPEHRARIFEIFQRGHGRDDYDGTGIGLAICKRIVERHGGRIWNEPSPGQGATFYFTLQRTRTPLREPPPEADTGTEEVAAKASVRTEDETAVPEVTSGDDLGDDPAEDETGADGDAGTVNPVEESDEESVATR